MDQTITRNGEVTHLALIEGKQSATIKFAGGYIKLFFSELDIPNGLMLKDKVEVSLLIPDND